LRLPAGEDPDTFIQRQGSKAYGERLKGSQPYLEYLLERLAGDHDLNSSDGRVLFVEQALLIADDVSERTRQELFVRSIAEKARVSEDILWPRVRKAAGRRQAGPAVSLPEALKSVTKAEKGLIWLLIHDPGKALAALDDLESADLDGLASRSVLDLAKKLKENSKFSPTFLLDQTMAEAPYITGIASESEPHVHDASECVRELKRRRYTREVAAVQQEIDRQQQRGAPEVPGELDALLRKKHELIQKMQVLA
jgi:DNA primase